MRKHDDDLALMDRVHAFTFMRKPMPPLAAIDEVTFQVQLKTRQLLRRAQRFVLDDDAVQTICHLSREFDRIEAWSFLARLPYDVVWFELDLHVKVREFDRMGTLVHPFDPKEVPRRMGYLMFREEPDTDNPRWCCQEWVISKDGTTEPGSISYVFDPEGDPKFPIRGSKFWNSATLSMRRGMPKITTSVKIDGKEDWNISVDPEIVVGGMWGWEGVSESFQTGEKFFYASKIEVAAEDLHQGRLVAPPWLTPRMAVIMDPWWDAYTLYCIDYKKHDTLNENLLKSIMKECVENSGHLRWILSMLAAINGLPKSIKPRAFRPGKRTVGANLLPYFQSSTISLTIPREDQPYYYMARALTKAARADPAHRAWHMVRGHWRVVELGKRKFICRHVPVMVESGLGICENCQLLVRWIPAHERGDATLGVVDHTYRVET